MALEIPHLLSLSPRIWADESHLMASTPWILKILTLGLWLLSQMIGVTILPSTLSQE